MCMFQKGSCRDMLRYKVCPIWGIGVTCHHPGICYIWLVCETFWWLMSYTCNRRLAYNRVWLCYGLALHHAEEPERREGRILEVLLNVFMNKYWLDVYMLYLSTLAGNSWWETLMYFSLMFNALVKSSAAEWRSSTGTPELSSPEMFTRWKSAVKKSVASISSWKSFHEKNSPLLFLVPSLWKQCW